MVSVRWGLPYLALPKPPHDLQEEEKAPPLEVDKIRESCPFLFVPPELDLENDGLPSGLCGSAPWAAAGGSAAAEQMAGAAAPPARTVGLFDLRDEYRCEHVTSAAGMDVMGLLLAPGTSARGGGTLAQAFGRALGSFVEATWELQTKYRPDGTPIQPENERNAFLPEAQKLVSYLVTGGYINAKRDLTFALDAFGHSKQKPAQTQAWMARTLRFLTAAALEGAGPADADEWRTVAKTRVKTDQELYTTVDVRNWLEIMHLFATPEEKTIAKWRQAVLRTVVDQESWCKQLGLQLLLSCKLSQRLQGLQEAAATLAVAGMTTVFSEDRILEMFNDRKSFVWRDREGLLKEVLKGTPRRFKQGVLRIMDNREVDLEIHGDDEMRLLQQLVVHFEEDIRCCDNATFKMRRDWLSDKDSGLISSEVLTAEQICDHFEDEENHPEMLKFVVNRMLHNDRHYEVAKILCRPASRNTPVFETNKNQKQISYIMRVISEHEVPPDRFGPVDTDSMELPVAPDEVRHVQDVAGCEALARELVDSQVPNAVGVAWFWRCFNPKLDFRFRASYIALAWDTSAAIIDLASLEEESAPQEAAAKRAIQRIFEASHLLKVVHALEQSSLEVLQRGVLPAEQLLEEDPKFTKIAPLVDTAIAAAWATRSKVGEWHRNLHRLVSHFLKLELCIAEQLSNFERRRLRQSQIHFALTLAFAPLMTIRAMCAYDIFRVDGIAQMVLSVGSKGTKVDFRGVDFHIGGTAEGDDGEDCDGDDGTYGDNLWLAQTEGAKKWRERLSKHSHAFDHDLHKRLSDVANQDIKGGLDKNGKHTWVRPAFCIVRAEDVTDISVRCLFEQEKASQMLQAMYAKYADGMRLR